MASNDDANLAYGKLKAEMLDLLTKHDYFWLSRRLGLSLNSHDLMIRSTDDLLSALESRGFLMNDEEEMKRSEILLRERNVPAAELVKDYLEKYAGKLKGIHPASFGELKVRLRQMLTAKHVYELGTLFEFKNQELDKIQRHPVPALRLLDNLCAKNIIDEHNVSPLLKAFETINHHAAATVVNTYIEEHDNPNPMITSRPKNVSKSSKNVFIRILRRF